MLADDTQWYETTQYRTPPPQKKKKEKCTAPLETVEQTYMFITSGMGCFEQ